MPRKILTQEEEKKIYNSLTSEVYRVHTLPYTIQELEDGTVSTVSTPFGILIFSFLMFRTNPVP